MAVSIHPRKACRNRLVYEWLRSVRQFLAVRFKRQDAHVSFQEIGATIV
jgi:hypothetical protein